ncbi:MAG: InlB B-repeat-containing protein [Bacilli bacterium]
MGIVALVCFSILAPRYNISAASIDDWMPDPVLQEAVRSELGLGTVDEITYDNILLLNEIEFVNNETITSFSGLENATNLKVININNIDLSNVSLTPLTAIESLESLKLTNVNISDISEFQSVYYPNLTDLNMQYNNIEDISVVETVNLPTLEILDVSHNIINDISSIANASLPSLMYLNASYNNLENIEPLKDADFPNIAEIYASDNKLHDVEVMRGLSETKFPNLNVFEVSRNNIIDITPIENYLLYDAFALEQYYETDITFVIPNDGEETFYIDNIVSSLKAVSQNGVYLMTADPYMLDQNISIWDKSDNVSSNFKVASRYDGEAIDSDKFSASVRQFSFTASPESLPASLEYDFSATQGRLTGTVKYNIEWVYEYDLNFDLNGGTSTTPETQVIIEGGLATVVENPTRENYKFLSWNTAADGSGYTWNFATSTMPASDVILYAQWEYSAESELPDTGMNLEYIMTLLLIIAVLIGVRAKFKN